MNKTHRVSSLLLAGAMVVLGTLGAGASSAHAESAISATRSASVPASGHPGASGTAGPGAAGSSLRATLKAIGPAVATGKTVSLARGKQGIFAIGPNGHSLYVYDKDHGSKSACTGACAPEWPALTAKQTITFGALINKSELGKTTGQVPDQVTYYGHLLYYYKGDTAPGQTNGITIPGFHLLGPFGNIMLPRA